MKKGGAGTAILLILFLLIIVVLLFPNQVQQFLEQFNISLGNGTSNSSQLSQQFTNGSQNYVNSGNSYNSFTTFFVTFPIFNAGTFNIGVSSKSTYVGPIDSFYYGPFFSTESPIASTDTNVNVYENGNNINFAFSLKYSGVCNNSIDTINIQNPSLYIIIYSFDPNEVSYYNNYFGNSNFITYKDIKDIYWAIWDVAKKYNNITVLNNRYGFSCKPIGVVKLNPTVTVSCSIDLNQLKSDPEIRNIENIINSVGNSSLWAGAIIVNVTYNCQ